MTDHHPYRIGTRSGDLYVLWRRGEGDDRDAVAADDRGRLLAFHAVRSAEEHCARHHRDFVTDAESSLDLEPVAEWVRAPGPVPAAELLEAWNFFEDLAQGVDTSLALPVQGAAHDAAYDRFFEAGDGALWTDGEAAAAHDLLRIGLALWEEAVRGAVVPDAHLLARRAGIGSPPVPDAFSPTGHENGQCRTNT
ncbi:hypothetical protein ACFY84_08510 [Streptomyces sp. NPDC012438]|uniref:hypothetical protein n=1 Tax=Streptomyces sp. NPDC012438 TaxID=3364833 RepID=UPI0036E83976